MIINIDFKTGKIIENNQVSLPGIPDYIHIKEITREEMDEQILKYSNYVKKT